MKLTLTQWQQERTRHRWSLIRHCRVPVPQGRQNARQQAKSTTSPTERDLITALEGMRRRDPAQFVTFVMRNEAAVFQLLGPLGFRGCWDKPDAYLADFDASISRWVQRGNLFNLTELHVLNMEEEEKKDQQVGLWALPGGGGYVGTRKQYRAVKERLYWERQGKTGKNIAGGIFGALGYMAGGDEGSDVGANVDALAGAAAGVAERRAYNQSLSTPAARPVAAEVRPLTDSGKKVPPPATPTATSPAAPAKVQSQATSTASPTSTAAVVPPARTPMKTTSTATPTSARESWSEWSAVIDSAGRPTPRKSDNGFRTETRVDKEGRFQVVVTEGIVGPPAKGKSTAPYGETLKGEHSTHPVGRQLGEDVGPHAQGSGPSDLNLSGMKKVENRLRAIHEIAAEQGASVTTRTTMVTELRKSGNGVVPVLVGVRREAWLRMPGSDKETPILRYEATVDRVTRVAVETEVVWGPAAKTTE
jgi:hypothetical protein